MKRYWGFVIVGVVAMLGFAAQAADWPQWRGPERNGHSKETGLLKEWPKDGPKLVWQIHDIGNGYSTPAVVGDRLYLLSNKGLDDESVQALAVKDGKQVWSTRLGKVGNPRQQPNFPGARSTPTVDGELLYALSSNGDLACLETATGKEKWHKSLRDDFSGKPGIWAYSESPLIDGDRVVCTPGGTEASLVALNKKTGEVIWKCAVPGGDAAGYASIVIVNDGGVKQYVQFMHKGLVGVDANTGKFLWRYDRTAQGSAANIPTPVAHAGYVYSAAGMSGGGLVKLKADQGGIEDSQVYFSRTLPKDIGGTILLDGNLYGTSGPAGLECVDFKTGNIKWKNKAIGSASLCYADGRLYLHGENNEMALVEPSPDGYHPKGRFTLPDQPQHINRMQKAWAYPVVANGRLYVRDLDTLWCYDIKSGD